MREWENIKGRHEEKRMGGALAIFIGLLLSVILFG